MYKTYLEQSKLLSIILPFFNCEMVIKASSFLPSGHGLTFSTKFLSCVSVIMIFIFYKYFKHKKSQVSLTLIDDTRFYNPYNCAFVPSNSTALVTAKSLVFNPFSIAFFA